MEADNAVRRRGGSKYLIIKKWGERLAMYKIIFLTTVAVGVVAPVFVCGSLTLACAASGPATPAHPVVPVVRNNHDMKILLENLWFEKQRTPILFTNFPVLNFVVQGRFTPTEITFDNPSENNISQSGSKGGLSVFKMKLTRIIFRNKDITKQLATIKPHGVRNIAYYVATIDPVHPAQNEFWKFITDNTTRVRYLAFQVLVLVRDSCPTYTQQPSSPMFFCFRAQNRTFLATVDSLSAPRTPPFPLLRRSAKSPVLPGSKLYREIGTFPGVWSPIRFYSMPGRLVPH